MATGADRDGDDGTAKDATSPGSAPDAARPAGSEATRSAKAAGTSESSAKEKKLPPAAKRKMKSAGTASQRRTEPSRRYTAPIPAEKKGPSPIWVPVLMFGLWAVGLAMILLNYMGVLPGSGDDGNGWYLLGGLGLILGGIITATQYR